MLGFWLGFLLYVLNLFVSLDLYHSDTLIEASINQLPTVHLPSSWILPNLLFTLHLECYSQNVYLIISSTSKVSHYSCQNI